jgi:hypothetical protein
MVRISHRVPGMKSSKSVAIGNDIVENLFCRKSNIKCFDNKHSALGRRLSGTRCFWTREYGVDTELAILRSDLVVLAAHETLRPLLLLSLNALMPLRRVSAALPPSRLTVRFYTSQTNPVTIGIRREDPQRVWERRAPLTPDAVAALVSRDNVRVLVQECERRVFPLEEYIRVRAIYVRDSEFIIERRRHSGGCGGTLDT